MRRLVNVTSLELEEFFDDNLPPYAILSHRWQGDEVSFQDMQNDTGRAKAGFVKIGLICEEARRRHLNYAWVDTCCIDKTSSAELSEAINSMYRWYKNAVVCCVFLFDMGLKAPPGHDCSFRDSSWWSRGWTLQELIAPSEVAFFDSSWHFLGTKESLQDVIADITGIGLEVLCGEDPELCSVAQRMAWMSNRTTTRVEDMAYCLLGLFGVNMPLLYGEGERAFIRLQEEIMKHSDDHSLFAWHFEGDGHRGLLAMSPADFRQRHDVVVSQRKTNRKPYSITNMGLSIELLMKPWAMDTYLVALDCYSRKKYEHRKPIGIYLKLMRETNQMARVSVNGSCLFLREDDLNNFEYKSVYVRQNVSRLPPGPPKKYGFWLRTLPTSIKTKLRSQIDEHVLVEVTSRNEWSYEDRMLEIPIGKGGTAGVLWYKSDAGFSALKLGFDSNFNPACLFGGPAWTAWGREPGSYSADKEVGLADVFKLHSTWLEDLDRDCIIAGDRLDGLESNRLRPIISIQEELVNGSLVWVVNIEQTDNDIIHRGPRHQGVQCDGCLIKNFRGPRYKCRQCEDYDLCENCHVRAKIIHPFSHTFMSMLSHADLYGVKTREDIIIPKFSEHGKRTI